MTDIRLCSVETNGPIKEMGNITGPVRKCRLDLPKILSMINNGHVIYELNPENLNEKVRLTLTNAIPSPFSKSEPINKINHSKTYTYNGGIVGLSNKTEDVDNSYTVNTAEQLASVATLETSKDDETAVLVNEISIAKDTLSETNPVVEGIVDTANKPVNVTSITQNQYNKYDKKNKHKHNKNNYNNNVAKQTTVEEKVVKSDF